MFPLPLKKSHSTEGKQLHIHTVLVRDSYRSDQSTLLQNSSEVFETQDQGSISTHEGFVTLDDLQGQRRYGKLVWPMCSFDGVCGHRHIISGRMPALATSLTPASIFLFLFPFLRARRSSMPQNLGERVPATVNFSCMVVDLPPGLQSELKQTQQIVELVHICTIIMELKEPFYIHSLSWPSHLRWIIILLLLFFPLYR